MRGLRLASVVSLLFAAACTASTPSASPAARPSWQRLSCVSAVGSRPYASDAPGFATRSWKTDFANHCVPLSEITSGGPPPDGIPPLDKPQFYESARADKWLQPQEPVIAVAEGDEARAYPLQILIWHEIVNDTIAGRPIVVTFCPLCNTSLVFDRTVDGRALTFGTTGNLRYSDLVMWDRETQSWWQQATGEAIVGELTGARLTRIRALVVSYEEFKKARPSGLVLSREAANEEATRKSGSGRDYGRNPYAGYDRADTPPIPAFWGSTPIDRRLLPKARIAVVTFSQPPVAYPIDDLRAATAVNDTVGGRSIVLLARRGVASPLDAAVMREGTEIGQATLFDRQLEGRTLTFRGSGSAFRDDETGSTWLVTGLAVSVPLAGKRLAALDHEVTFWFIWSVFRPDTEVRRPSP